MSLLDRLAHALEFHFWPIWLLGLVIVLVVSLWMFRRRTIESLDDSPSAEERGTTVAAKPNGLVAWGFGAFLLLYVGFMLWGEEFAYRDGHHFTDFSAIGTAHPPSVWLNVGRFFPLGYQEYNFVAHLAKTATAYVAFGAVELVIGL